MYSNVLDMQLAIQQLTQAGVDQWTAFGITESLCSLVMSINVLVVSEYCLLAVSVKYIQFRSN